MNHKMKIMVVDDEMIIRESFYHWFTKAGYDTETAVSGVEALAKLEICAFDILFVDIKMPHMSGIQLLEKINQEYPDTIVVIITAFGTIESAVQAMKMGAADYLLKPFQPEQLNLVLEKLMRQKTLESECRYLQGRLDKFTRFENIIGQSAAMQEVYDLIPEVADSDASVLIVGETGTGKELVAKAVHAKSQRQQNPFIAINCGALPDTLLESELFGHQKGAFSGAIHSRKGFLEIVSGGSLFLDEIGEISHKMQVDLLRVLDEKKITPIGSSQSIDVDFRLISATRRNLEKAIENKTFRPDFFYRINVIIVPIPPLRKRKEDIPLLVNHFIQKYSQETTKQVDHVTDDALMFLHQYNWPGNVRELENAVERAIVLSKSRTLRVEDFSFLQPSYTPAANKMSLMENEKEHIRHVLAESEWNVTKAAQVLDISRATLHRKIKRYRIEKRKA